jgi:hypothetical protein
MGFLFGVLCAVVLYILNLLFSKGASEDIASYYGKKLIAKLNLRGQDLRKQVEESITQIDDILLTQPINALAKIDSIVNKSSNDEVFTKLLDQTFKLSVLLEKYHENVES